MNNSFQFAFVVALASLIGVPILAPIFAWKLSKETINIQRKVLFTLVGYVGFVAAALILGFSFRSYEINLVFTGFTYLCFGVLAFSVFRIRPSVLGISLGVLASFPVLVGLLLGTGGILVVTFIVGDSIPIYVGSNQGATCYVNSFGNATTADGGYDVTIKRRLPVITFVEHTIKKVRFTNPTFPPSDACK